jgi:hypothetical protein
MQNLYLDNNNNKDMNCLGEKQRNWVGGKEKVMGVYEYDQIALYGQMKMA